MDNYKYTTVCFNDINKVVNDVSKLGEDNVVLSTFHGLDDLPIRIPLWKKHNLIAYNFKFEIRNNIMVCFCDLMGEEKDLDAYFEDSLQNYKHYLRKVKLVFDNGPEIIVDEEAKRRMFMEKSKSNPPPRRKYNAKTHKFEEGYVSNNQEQ